MYIKYDIVHFLSTDTFMKHVVLKHFNPKKINLNILHQTF